MIIDYHSHFFQPEWFGDRLLAEWEAAGYPPFPRTTMEQFEEAMATVDRAIVFGLTATVMGVRTPHEPVAELVRRNPTKFIGFMALDPADPGAVEEMEYCSGQLGLKGIKVYPAMAHIDVGDRRWAPFFARAQQLGLPILFHFGASPFPGALLKYSQPLLVDELAASFPELHVIIAHLGHPWQRETILMLRKHRNVYSDISGLWKRPWEGYNALVRCQEWGVTHKLLFGSDFPIWTPAAAIDGIKAVIERFGKTGVLPDIPAGLVEEILHRDVLKMMNLA